jgi:hypothetical protein
VCVCVCVCLCVCIDLHTYTHTHTHIGERSWCADAYVFEPLLHDDGHISALEHATYQVS